MSTRNPPYRQPELGEHYRSLSLQAVLSLLCGLLSPLVLAAWSLSLIPLAGIVLGVSALGRIRRAPEALSGRQAARVGIGFSAVFWLAATFWVVYAGAKEVPHGYIPVGYSELQGGSQGHEIPARAMELDGKKVFLKGFMYPGRQQVDIKEFLMSRDSGSCSFCMPNPTPTDLIQVVLAGDLRTAYTTRPIALGGKLRVETDPAKIAQQGVIYHLDADYLK